MKKTKKILIISCITILVVSMITSTFAVTQKDAENVKNQINDTEEEIKKVLMCCFNCHIAILYVQMVDTQRKSMYGNSRKSAGNCHILPL